MTGIDWLKSTTEMRQILYRYVQLEMARKNLTLYKFLEKVTGRSPAGKGYDGNMRAGTYSKKSASLMFDWLETVNPAIAKIVESEVVAIDENIDDAWNMLLCIERKPLTVLSYDPSTLGAARFPSLIPLYEISRGKPFYFQFVNEDEGYAIGFQKQNNRWLSLPLDRQQDLVAVSSGMVELPKNADGRNVDPIVEEEARDLLEFLIIVFSDKTIKLPKANNNEGILERNMLNEFAHNVLNAVQSCIIRVNW